MRLYWGYKIAFKCNERAERASYRCIILFKDLQKMIV